MKAPITKHLPSPLLALIRITPPPTSTIYTSALLTKLQTFGSVLEFRPVPSPTGTSSSLSPGEYHHPAAPAPASYAVRFGTSTALERALAASPLSITIPASNDVTTPPPSDIHHQQDQGQQQQPPTVAPRDPYDVLQRHNRPCHPTGVFTCSVSPLAEHQQHHPHHQRRQQQRHQQPRQRLVPHRGTAALHDALIDSGAPTSLAVGLSLRPELVADTDGESRPQREQQQDGTSTGQQVSPPSPPLRLMDLYRAAVGREGSKSVR